MIVPMFVTSSGLRVTPDRGTDAPDVQGLFRRNLSNASAVAPNDVARPVSLVSLVVLERSFLTAFSAERPAIPGHWREGQRLRDLETPSAAFRCASWPSVRSRLPPAKAFRRPLREDRPIDRGWLEFQSRSVSDNEGRKGHADAATTHAEAALTHLEQIK
jgi:hypothetical protein